MDLVGQVDEIENGCEHFTNYRADYEGLPHPDLIQEGTALSWTSLPQNQYKLHLPLHITSPGRKGLFLSAPQIQAVRFACAAHQNFFSSGARKGFLLGDGTGTGKTLTLAAIIGENVFSKQSSRALWISANDVLLESVRRELNRIVPSMHVESVKNFTPSDIAEKRDIVLYATYSCINKPYYSSLIEGWMGEDYNGLLILDEAHAAKGALNSKQKNSKIGEKILLIQNTHKAARVVYSTATSAYEIRHFCYMERLGIWGPNSVFHDYEDFYETMSKRPVAAMEYMSMELKKNGVFLSRQLSFHGVSFESRNVPFDPSSAEYQIYNRSTDLINLAKSYMDRFNHCSIARSTFYSGCLNFFLALIASSKIKTVVQLCREEVAANRVVIVGIQRTGDSLFAQFRRDYRIGNPYSNAEYILRNMLIAIGINVGQTSLYLTDGSIIDLSYRRKPSDSSDSDSSDSDSSDSDSSDSDSSNSDSSDSNSDSNSSSDSSSSTDDDDSSDSKSYDSDISDSSKLSEVSSKKPKHDCGHTIYHWEESMVGFSLRYGPEQLIWSDIMGEKEGHLETDEERADDLFFSSDDSGSSKAAIDRDQFFKDDDERSDTEKNSDNTKRMAQKQLAERIKRTFHELAPFLPINPLDDLKAQLQHGLIIEELTSRGSEYTRRTDNNKKWERKARRVTDKFKLSSVNRVQDGPCNIVIVSDAASVGISLHADKLRKNNLPRTQITLELGWAADKLIQQLGRSHRSNQVCPPKYILVNSWIPAEVRVSSIIGQRLAQLGAITNAQSEGCPLTQGLPDNICTEKGVKAINGAINVLHDSLIGMKLIKENSKDMAGAISGVFNRLMMQKIDIQDTFLSIVTNALKKERKRAHFVEIPRGNCNWSVNLLDKDKFEFRSNEINRKVELLSFSINRIRDWPTEEDNWVYIRVYENCTNDILIKIKEDKFSDTIRYNYIAPHKRNNIVSPVDAITVGTVVSKEEAKMLWSRRMDEMAAGGCIHQAQRQKCRTKACHDRWGIKNVHLVTGDILAVWDILKQPLDNDFSICKISFVDKSKNHLSVVGIYVDDSEYIDVFRALNNIPSVK